MTGEWVKGSMNQIGRKFSDMFHKSGFYILVIFLCGTLFGVYMSSKVMRWEAERAIFQKVYVYDDRLYNIVDTGQVRVKKVVENKK